MNAIAIVVFYACGYGVNIRSGDHSGLKDKGLQRVVAVAPRVQPAPGLVVEAARYLGQPPLGHIAFYASRVDEARVGGEIVQAQPGDFYGGWITSRVIGPFKGAPGTLGW